MVCNKQLSTGEELYVIDENKFVCKDDYLSSSSLKEGSLNSGRKPSSLPGPGPSALPTLPPAWRWCPGSELSTQRSRHTEGPWGAGEEGQRWQPASQDTSRACSSPALLQFLYKRSSSSNLEPRSFPFPSLFSSC